MLLKTLTRLLFTLSLAGAVLHSARAATAIEGPVPSKGYAMFSADGDFKPYEFERHAVGDHDVLIEILYAGICHSDIHSVRSEWGGSPYPVVPGHEIVGRVTQVGKDVTKFTVGDIAGVGCMVNSCGECEMCRMGEEQFCTQGAVFTYGSKDRFHGDAVTQGGYSNNIVVKDAFAVNVPADADLSRVAPLLCAGITTYSPLRRADIQAGDKVAVAGFGGLGHLAVKYALSFGAEVTVFDITEEKRDAALEMGAVRYVNVKKEGATKGLNSTFDYVLSTIPKPYDPMMYVNMLKLDGEMVIVGLPAFAEAPSILINRFIFSARRKVSGSLIGGMPETQEMLDYSIAHDIYPDVEMIAVDQIDAAYDAVVDGEVQFRYVIDMATMD
ncbi:NAD(P)-dependent alcohol dehydrogenase [Actomonas aquatica]|uniref:NAD(P)-dependent alcohol dehydrogenase n=1 Tax=Actomonas aquatica TaxID=2866162 RepID=A0ABZ1C3X7_9BACT|nr:NAD(P)-dependent alcohol dehydrogenase [Opitutus sp. WL0086]WRQ85998.1 NAD(P)-dependent alcohol dehydrogenase [Opitutus sp. WL0086]